MKKRLVALFLVLMLALSAASSAMALDKIGSSNWHSDVPSRGGGGAPGPAKNTVYLYN